MSGMVKLSEAVSIAIHAMALMSVRPGRMLSAKDIASPFGLSQTHVAKVMQRLVKAGLAVSTRGPAGGFKLGRPSDDISLLDIYQTVEGPLENSGCLLNGARCGGEACILGEAVGRINRILKQVLTDNTLAGLAGSIDIESVEPQDP